MDEQNRQAAIGTLENFPRLRLGFFPTPLDEMPRLRARLGKNCPRIFIKRDDLSGFGFGGNKIRKLEYVFEKIKREGVKTVLTTGGERSNHARMTAFFCARLGMRCILVLDRKPRPAGAGNLKPAAVFLEKMLGAEVHIVDAIAERKAKATQIIAEHARRGEKIFEIPLGGALAVGALGFISAMGELAAQAKEKNVKFDRIIFSSSTAGTHAGMLAGKKLFGFENVKITGFAPEPETAEIVSGVEKLLGEVGELLGFSTDDLRGEIEIVGDYAGEDYCVETAEAQNAFKLLARAEGVFLDSVYTAKAFAGLIDWIKSGRLKENENVLFWHTGGQLTQFYVP